MVERKHRLNLTGIPRIEAALKVLMIIVLIESVLFYMNIFI
jgi:hypothetical protein